MSETPGDAHSQMLRSAHQLRVGHSVIRWAAWVALVCWAVIATLGVAALALSSHNQAAASSNAARAAARSATAVRRSATAVRLSAAAIAAQHGLLVQNCDRLNVVTAEDNRSHLADYNFFRLLLPALQLAARADAPRARHRLDEHYLRVARREVDAKSWVQTINCATVTANYRLGPAIPFAKQMPPASALSP